MRKVRAAALSAVVMLSGLLGGCFSPDYDDATTPCGPAGECPSGLLCAADLKCYHAGKVPQICDAGFERSSAGSCVDIDECRAGTDACDGHASCANTQGGYTCTCDVGYTGDGKTCTQTFAQIATAGDHTCGRRSDGALFCWGSNSVGQLGAGQGVPDTHAPVRIGSDTWSAIATGAQYTCGIKMDGTLWCWGDGACAVLGDGGDNLFCDGARPVYLPYPTGGASRWQTIATGRQHACAIQTDGSLWCWGENGSGQLGTSDTDARTIPTRVGDDTAANKTWTAIATGDDHTCGLRAGQLWCWGENSFGQLGDNGAEQAMSFPKRIGTSATFAKVAAGDAHTCAVLGDQSLACWGDGAAGQLGLGDGALTTGAATPTPVPGATRWTDVAAGGRSSCARTAAGALLCFGDNTFGQIGDGSFVRRSSPAAVAGATSWANVTVGFRQACATTAAGASLCWGQNSEGSIGAGTGGEVDAPTDVASSGYTQLATGSNHQCGIKTDNSLWCWGSNLYGQLGIGVDGGYRDQAVAVAGGGRFSAVSAGEHSTCAIQTDGALRCWGAGFYGELGQGTTDGSVISSPAPVTNGGSWTRVATRFVHTCGIQTDGTLWCWGLPSSGRLGLGAGLPLAVVVPTLVQGSGYTAVSVGVSHTCAVQSGALVCFGDDGFGQLGTGQVPPANQPVLTPVIVGSFRDWSAVSAGQYHTCGIRSSQKSLSCWGYNYYGQVGNGSSGASADVYQPADVAFGTSWLTAFAGDFTTCGVGMDSKLRCWGSNAEGLVGNGNAGEIVVTPVAIGGAAADYVSVGLMAHAGCALHGDGGYACWGRSPSGEFGDDATFYETPVAVTGF